MTNPYQLPGLPDPTPPPPDPQVPPYGVPVHHYQQPMYPYPYQPPRPPTEGLAIASLVVSCAAVLGVCTYGVGGLLGVVGAILGHVARHRIRRTGTDGAGLALAGIIVGWTLAGFTALIAAILITLFLVDPHFASD
jgi:hypothetical protein